MRKFVDLNETAPGEWDLPPAGDPYLEARREAFCDSLAEQGPKPPETDYHWEASLEFLAICVVGMIIAVLLGY